MTARKHVSAAEALRPQHEEQRTKEERPDSKRLARLRASRPDLDIVALTSEQRMALQELMEEHAAEVQELADSIAAAAGVSGEGYTLQVSEGVFVRPRKEQIPTAKSRPRST